MKVVLENKLEMGNNGSITFYVKDKDASGKECAFGRLEIRRSGIEWKRKNAQNGHKLNWKEVNSTLKP